MISPEQYLEIERKAAFKSEYCGGRMWPLGEPPTCSDDIGAQRLISLNTRAIVERDTGGSSGKIMFVGADDDVGLDPRLIIRVTLPSTEAYDRGRKFESYRTIASLKQYVLIASDRISVDTYTRDREGRWILTSASKPEEVIALESVECRVRLADLYDKTELLAPEA